MLRIQGFEFIQFTQVSLSESGDSKEKPSTEEKEKEGNKTKKKKSKIYGYIFNGFYARNLISHREKEKEEQEQIQSPNCPKWIGLKI